MLQPGEEMLLFYGAGLDLMEDGNILTPIRLISYSTEDGDFFFNEMHLAEVSSWELEKGSLIEDSVLTVFSHTGDEIYLLLSSEGGGDDEFVQRLARLVEGQVVMNATSWNRELLRA